MFSLKSFTKHRVGLNKWAGKLLLAVITNIKLNILIFYNCHKYSIIQIKKSFQNLYKMGPCSVRQYLLSLTCHAKTWPLIIIFFLLLNTHIILLWWHKCLDSNSPQLCITDKLQSKNLNNLSGNCCFLWLKGLLS